MKSTKIHLRKKEPPISSTASLSSVSSHAFPNDGNLLVRFQSTKSIIKSLIGCLEHLNCYRKANDVIQNVPEEIAMSIEPEDPGGDQPDNFSNDSDFDRMLERARLFLYNTSNDSMTVPNFPENDLDHMLEQASICLCNPWQAFPLKRVLIEFPIESSIKYVQITCGGGVKMVLRDGKVAIGTNGEVDDTEQTKAQRSSYLRQCRKIIEWGQTSLYPFDTSRFEETLCAERAARSERASREGNGGTEVGKEGRGLASRIYYKVPRNFQRYS